jgi:DNA-binding response OmpR family regulator
MARDLSSMKERALPAPSASDALRLCGYNPEPMLLDLILPDAAGIDVLRRLGRGSERPARPRPR